MYEVDRRTAMKLALATGSALTVPTIATAQEKAPAADEAAQAALTVSSGSNPVLFWNGVSLDLVALDHSLPPSQARAPGPCATSYALGLVHAAIADAVKFAYAASYDHALAAGTGPAPSNRAAFVGGTAAGVLAYIFSTPAHVQLTELRRQEFSSSWAHRACQIGRLDLLSQTSLHHGGIGRMSEVRRFHHFPRISRCHGRTTSIRLTRIKASMASFG